jgi:hypothetical protein
MTENQKDMFLKALHEFGTCNVRVNGSSMWPFIRNNDILCIKHPFKKPQLGMVVATFSKNQLIVHRIVRYKKIRAGTWELALCGDSSPYSLSKIVSNNIVGILSHIQRKDKIIKLWFSPPIQIGVVPLGFFFQLILIFLKKHRGS